jgi:hypothetical protein
MTDKEYITELERRLGHSADQLRNMQSLVTNMMEEAVAERQRFHSEMERIKTNAAYAIADAFMEERSRP